MINVFSTAYTQSKSAILCKSDEVKCESRAAIRFSTSKFPVTLPLTAAAGYQTKHVSSSSDLHCSLHGADSNHKFPAEENSAGGKLLELRSESEDVGCGKALRCGAAVGPGCPATQEEKGGRIGNEMNSHSLPH